MTLIWRTATIFISSTFQDMQFERDLINRMVLPGLREYFKFYRIAVRVIDLRWGINTIDNEESEVERRIVNVCLDEIDRSRPFFIGIIGNRYGWIPPAQLDSGAKSVTEIEIDYGALRDKDSLDNSIVCIRDIIIPEDMRSSYYENDPTKVRKINELREHLTNIYAGSPLEENFISYDAEWNPDTRTLDGLSVLSDFLTASLKRLICRRFGIDPNNHQVSAKSDYEILNSIFEDYIHSSLTMYISRTELEHTVIDTLGNNRLCYITGRRGNGKSSFLCRLHELLEPSNIVLYYNESLSPGMDKRLECLTLWDYILSCKMSLPFEESVPSVGSSKIYSRKVAVRSDLNFHLVRLQEMSRRLMENNRNVVCLIDSEDNHLKNDFVVWLHDFLPDFSFIAAVPESLSAADGFDVYDIPPFNENEVTGYLVRRFGHYDKELHRSVVDAVCGKISDKDGNALWLNIMTYLLLNLDAADFAAISSGSKGSGEENIEYYFLNLIRHFPDDPAGLFSYVYEKSVSRFDEGLVRRSLSLLSVSKNGLRDEDLEHLLEEKWDSIAFAAFRRWFSPFLTESADTRCWNFSSRLFKECVYLSDISDSSSDERELAELLWNYSFDDPVRYTSLFYHLARCGMYERCGETILAAGADYIGSVRELFECVFDQGDAKKLILNILMVLSPEKVILVLSKLLIQILHNLFYRNLSTVLDVIGFAMERVDVESAGLSEYALKSASVLIEEAILFIKQSGDDGNFLKYNEMLLEIALQREKFYPSKESRTSVSISASNLAKYHLSHGNIERADEFFSMI